MLSKQQQQQQINTVSTEAWNSRNTIKPFFWPATRSTSAMQRRHSFIVWQRWFVFAWSHRQSVRCSSGFPQASVCVGECVCVCARQASWSICQRRSTSAGLTMIGGRPRRLARHPTHIAVTSIVIQLTTGRTRVARNEQSDAYHHHHHHHQSTLQYGACRQKLMVLSGKQRGVSEVSQNCRSVDVR